MQTHTHTHTALLTSLSIAMAPLLLLLLLLLLMSPSPSSPLGINYGRVADNLPPPSAVLPLLRSLPAPVTHVKLYDSDPSVLRAFASSPFRLTLTIPDRLLPSLASNSSAAAFLSSALLPFIPSTNISTLCVGNEVLTSNSPLASRSLLPSILSLHSSLSSLNISQPISVTTPHSLAVLSSSFPPSAASFRPELLPYLTPLLNFLHSTGSPFLINAYPYFAYKADPGKIDLDYALLQPDQPGVVDPGTGLRYRNMLHAQVDAVRAAIARAVGEVKGKEIEIRVSETGWPSGGDRDEAGATPENARRYNGNLIRMAAEGKGTPMRPGEKLEVCLFALFNENLKPGPESERNYGLFWPDGTPVYKLQTGSSAGGAPVNKSSEGGGIEGGATVKPSPPGGSGGDGALQISMGTKVECCPRFCRGALKRALVGFLAVVTLWC